MIISIASLAIGLSVVVANIATGDDMAAYPTQNICCVLPNGQQCCAPTLDVNGRPTGCGC